MLKALLRISFLLFIVINTTAQNWTWISSTDTINKSGIYGTLGVPSVTNYPGGREGAVTWKDASGNLWLFGGNGYSATGALGYLNDLWKYDPGTQQWTWVKGSNTINQLGTYGTQTVASGTNNPGGRYYPTSWTDASGKFWLFGGYGYASTGAAARLNDLWRYDPGTNQWTWMKGSNATNQVGIYGTLGVPSATTTPGARYDLVSWIDGSNNLWLFGGAGYGNVLGVGDLNDLWKYTPGTNNWTWMHGAKVVNQSAITGTLGIPNATNTPGGLHNAVSWVDASGNFCLFGGSGYNYQGGVGLLNDIWKYNTTINQWIWQKGSSTINQNGIYGTKGFSSPLITPGGRYLPAAWVDLAGDVYIFGGTGLPKNGIQGNLNDLWKYNPGLNDWAWINGSDTINQNGIYGSKGVTNSTNKPGGRNLTATWRDASGNFWMFGGGGFGKTGSGGYLNDLWKYDVCLAPPTPTADLSSSSNGSICSGSSATLSVLSNTGIVSWYATSSSTTALATGTTYITPPMLPGFYFYFAEAATCTVSANRVVITLDVEPSPVLVTSSTTSSLCAGEQVTLSVSGADTYTWNTGANTTTIIVTPSTTITYTATGTNTVNGCWSKNTILITVDPCVGVKEFGVSSSEFGVFPNPNEGSFNVKIGTDMKKGQLVIINSLGQIVFKQNVVNGNNQIVTGQLAKGIYTIVLLENNQEIKKGKIAID